MLRRATLTTASLFAVLGAAACAPGSTPAPTPTISEETTTSAAPQVQNPKNLKAVSDACQLLTQDQFSQLGGSAGAKPPESDTSGLGEPVCDWRNDAFSTSVTINITHGGPAAIEGLAGASDNFKPTQVDGYPGARVDEQSDLCRIELAVAEDQTVAINYFKNAGGTPEMDDPCGFAEKIASEALKNIPDA
ncbi:DUF3558 domain-containing protein [Saccharopolyspora sp. NPDC000359]|uniref:DUF3558 domain-containing protein n=1 Tax=Saccharopolyspora sp. NPDC000359 TaxID=3154251 RepID=UPI003330DEF1